MISLHADETSSKPNNQNLCAIKCEYVTCCFKGAWKRQYIWKKKGKTYVFMRALDYA